MIRFSPFESTEEEMKQTPTLATTFPLKSRIGDGHTGYALKGPFPVDGKPLLTYLGEPFFKLLLFGERFFSGCRSADFSPKDFRLRDQANGP